MHHKTKLKFYLVTILLVLAILIGYKVYLFVYESDYQALNSVHIEQIESLLHNKRAYKFAVIGNIKNSMRIFEQRMVPLIKEQGIDFMISAGNAVVDGAEDKYRLLFRGLKKAGIPYVLAVGRNEVEDFGAGKFYQHFGPYFFSFHLDNASFIFLDSSGTTPWKWQLRWLQQELIQAEKRCYRFVFLNHALFALPGFDSENDSSVLDEKISRQLQNLFSTYKVTTVFSSGYPIYHESLRQGVRYIISGGGGGLLLDRQEHYQFVKVEVGPNQILCKNVVVPRHMSIFREKLEILKLFLHSFFYMNVFNALLTVSLISLLALKIYALIIRQEHLYRDFSIDEEALSKTPLRVAMFTNNYLPFIGGVPLSIDRLYKGLVRLGFTVKIFAPSYRQPWEDPQDGSIVRCPGLFSFHLDNFPVINIFSRKITKEFNQCDCDLVHIHHPFWLGKKGLRLARKRRIPVVFTYHTRLEYYTHYIPLPGTALKNLVAHFVIKQFANRCDAIITPTASTEEYLRNLGVSALIETIPTGINIEEYSSWSDEQVQELRSQYVDAGEKLLISVSRLAEEKNLDFLIDGLAKVKSRSQKPFKCLLVGDGPERQRLMDKVNGLGLAEIIIFTGNIPPHEVVRCYLAADCFVFASTSETQGMVLLEAMAGGCPVVAVRASGVYDVVKDGYNGFAVTESTDRWAAKVAEILEDKRLLSSLSKNSRTFAENYSVEKIAGKVVKLYHRVMVIVHSKFS